MSGARSVSGRLVRSFSRFLRERFGEAAFEAVMRAHPPLSTVRDPSGEWTPIEEWQPILEDFEKRYGDPDTLRLVREMTRSTMAVAISKGWSAFLSGATSDSLLASAGKFWSMSYNSGRLVVAERGPKRVLFVIEEWPSPPAAVVASVAEAVAVFLARLGERSPRAVDRVGGAGDGRAEIELTW